MDAEWASERERLVGLMDQERASLGGMVATLNVYAAELEAAIAELVAQPVAPELAERAAALLAGGAERKPRLWALDGGPGTAGLDVGHCA